MDQRNPAVAWWRHGAGWLATGVAAGFVGIACTWILHGFSWLAFGFAHDSFLHGVAHAPAWRRVAALGIGGLVAGLAWWALRATWPPRNVAAAATAPEVDAPPDLPWWSTAGDAVIQLFAVGFGASIGRETAPRQVAAASAVVLSGRLGLPPERARTLLAVGAGAGLAAVYNVPLAGAVFVWEVLRHARRPTDAVGTLLTCLVAAAVAWPVVGWGPLLGLRLPDGGLTPGRLVPVVVAVAGAGLLVGAGFRRAVGRARRLAPVATWRLPVATTAGFLLVGAVAVARPEVTGNGKGILQLLLAAPPAVGVLVALLVLKCALTALTIGVGAEGGMLMPSMSIGAATGAIGGVAAGLDAPAITVCTVVGAVAVLAVTQRAPVFAALFALELTWPPLPVIAAAAGTALVAAVGGVVAHHLGVRRATAAARADRRATRAD